MESFAYPLMWSHVQLKGDSPWKRSEPLPERYVGDPYYRFSNFNNDEHFYDDSNFFGNPFEDNFKSRREYEEEVDENYSVLGLKKSASDEDIKKAFREKALETHPDKGGDPEEFRRVREAYESLS
jgi:hypothetical protein